MVVVDNGIVMVDGMSNTVLEYMSVPGLKNRGCVYLAIQIHVYRQMWGGSQTLYYADLLFFRVHVRSVYLEQSQARICMYVCHNYFRVSYLYT
jgi:hypothetical protein